MTHFQNGNYMGNEVTRMQQSCYNTAQKDIGLMKRIEPATNCSLPNLPLDPTRFSFHDPESDEKCTTDLSETAICETSLYNFDPDQSSECAYEDSEAEYMSSYTERGMSPNQTQGVFDSLGGTFRTLGKAVIGKTTEILTGKNKSANALADAIAEEIIKNKGHVKSPPPPGVPQGFFRPPLTPSPGGYFSPFPHQGQMYTGPQNLYRGPQQYPIEAQMAQFGPQRQSPYQSQTPFGQGFSMTNPYGPYQSKVPPGFGSPPGYSLGHAQQRIPPGYFQGFPQQQTPSEFGGPPGSSQGVSQQQTPPRFGSPPGYSQGLPNQQTPPGFGGPPGSSQGVPQQQTPPQFGGYPGYSEGLPQQQTLPGFGGPPGSSQGVPQQQTPPQFGGYPGYSEGLPQQQSVPGFGGSSGNDQGFPQQQTPTAFGGLAGYPEPQNPHQSFGQDPLPTRSPAHEASPALTRSPAFEASSSLSKTSYPTFARSAPSEYGNVELNIPPKKNTLAYKYDPAEVKKLEGDVLSSLKGIDNQINYILSKLELK